jgi:hypothetical protein
MRLSLRFGLPALALCLCLAPACGSSSGDDLAPGEGLAEVAPEVLDEALFEAGDAPGEIPLEEAVPEAQEEAGECQNGAISCDPVVPIQRICSGGRWETFKQCNPGDVCLGDTCVPNTPCTAGEAGPCAGVATASVCDASGKGYVAVDCEPGQYCADGACQATACVPGQPQCVDGESFAICLPDGSALGETTPCEDGWTCLAGSCTSACGDNIKYANSSIGCRFWSIDLGQWNVLPGEFGLDPSASTIPHAVVIANPNEVPAKISFKTGDGTPVDNPDPYVPAGQTRYFVMPVMSQQATAITRQSIRVTSSQPVVAAQFNPPSNKDLVHTSDASLLYPEGALGTEHVVVAGESVNVGSVGGMKMPVKYGYFTVVAVGPGTTSVTFAPTCPTQAGPLLEAIPAGQVTVLELQQWEVLTVQAAAPVLGLFDKGYDLLGTIIDSGQPVVVFGGNDCLNVGAGNCDHVETQLLPVEAWGQEYVAGHMEIKSNNLYRVTAAWDGTVLTTMPPIAGLNGVSLNRGEWAEASTDKHFVITATKPFQVISYMEGYDPGGTGGSGILSDPSMTNLIPTDQYRADYPLLVPADYAQDYVLVTRQAGTALQIDLQPQSDALFTPIPGTDWEVANIPLTEGMHRIQGTAPFGVQAWGVDTKVAYSYPAGANIKLSNILP